MANPFAIPWTRNVWRDIGRPQLRSHSRSLHRWKGESSTIIQSQVARHYINSLQIFLDFPKRNFLLLNGAEKFCYVMMLPRN